MFFIEIGLTLTVSMLGVLVAHATWPCLVHIDWTPFVLAFVILLMICMLLHILRWKCWSYLCHNRQRLQSNSSEHKPTFPFIRIVWTTLIIWSISYVLASTLLDCGTPWWPGLIVPCIYTIYTLSRCSGSCSSSEEEEEPSIVNALASTGGGLSLSESSSIGSTEPSSIGSSL